ncbi:di-heme oxidoredictase family protein [Inquilinus sp. CAU 1745]|uniref:di-heme oxidoreductase family protein n=1 Tax=Inquilinus sp. CAU 1745 TaxID=3140369 RepID=UPI00325B298D
MWKYALLVPFSLVLGLGSVLAGGDEEARIAAVTRPTEDFTAAEQYESRPAGAATLMRAPTIDAFSEPSANMSFDRELNFSVGNGIFRKMWVSSPASTASSDGLGPLFNARACQSCHLKDGRGHPPAPGDGAGGSMLVRISVPPETEAERAALASHRLLSIPEPTYGGQFQDLSIQGHSGEGRLVIEYEEFPVELSDGEIVHLRRPTYSFEDLAYGTMHPEVMLSARVAPPMIGLGLLEAVDETDILAHADPEDSDGDGISGRPNRVWDVEAGEVALGRFGWKAGEPSIRQQAAHAFSGDMGLSTRIAPAAFGDCTIAQPACRAAIDGVQPQYGEVEVPDEMFDLVVFYSRNLAVPMRRDIDDAQVLAGKELFYEVGCIGCHVPKYVTRRDETHPEQSFQLIWPYTDMLLHDMGEGLADHRPDGVATGREWRTPPLWGIGLTETVNGHTFFLHDGRARNLLEAILWHGGEARAARDRVVAMDANERRALLAFLNSL